MDLLKRIIKNKRIEIKKAKLKHPLPDLIKKINRLGSPRDFKKAIRKKNKLCIIAEIKKASPSAGIIRRDFNPVKLALSLAASGADALSVLTDKKFFQGDISYIKDIRLRVRLPILRKDFIFDEYQVYESRAYGADAILLITRILPLDKLRKLYSLAGRLGLSCLVEVHTHSDLKKALKIRPKIIGINNRNLANLKANLAITFDLKSKVPAGKVVVSESGIKNSKDIALLKANSVDALLIGEAFMKMKKPCIEF